MYNYDIKAMRFIVIVTAICLFFAMLVMNAYKYIPEEVNQSNSEKLAIPTTITTTVTDDNKNETENLEEDKSETTSEDLPLETSDELTQSVEKIEPLEMIEELNQVSNSDLLQKEEKSPEDENLKILVSNAEKLYEDGNYDDALRIYENIISKTNDKNLKAECLEKTSRISYKQRRYGNAILFMQQSNKLVPSKNKEIFLKQIYEKIDFNPINK